MFCRIVGVSAERFFGFAGSAPERLFLLLGHAAAAWLIFRDAFAAGVFARACSKEDSVTG